MDTDLDRRLSRLRNEPTHPVPIARCTAPHARRWARRDRGSWALVATTAAAQGGRSAAYDVSDPFDARQAARPLRLIDCRIEAHCLGNRATMGQIICAKW